MRTNYSIPLCFILSGYVMGIGMLVLVWMTLLQAYTHPNKTCIIKINTLGEQYLDIAVLLIATGVVYLGFLFLMIVLKHNKKELVKNG